MKIDLQAYVSVCVVHLSNFVYVCLLSVTFQTPLQRVSSRVESIACGNTHSDENTPHQVPLTASMRGEGSGLEAATDELRDEVRADLGLDDTMLVAEALFTRALCEETGIPMPGSSSSSSSTEKWKRQRYCESAKAAKQSWIRAVTRTASSCKRALDDAHRNPTTRCVSLLLLSEKASSTESATRRTQWFHWDDSVRMTGRPLQLDALDRIIYQLPSTRVTIADAINAGQARIIVGHADCSMVKATAAFRNPIPGEMLHVQRVANIALERAAATQVALNTDEVVDAMGLRLALEACAACGQTTAPNDDRSEDLEAVASSSAADLSHSRSDRQQDAQQRASFQMHWHTTCQRRLIQTLATDADIDAGEGRGGPKSSSYFMLSLQSIRN